MTKGCVLIAVVLPMSFALPEKAQALTINLSAGSDVFYVGCVQRAGLTSRIWGCNKMTGIWYQMNVDCVMDEDIFIWGADGNDTIVVGHGSDNGFSSTYVCGNETRNFGDITHTWGANNWDIYVEGEAGDDRLWGDQSRYTSVIAGYGWDELRQFGSGGLSGGTAGDLLFSKNYSYDLEEMYGGTGSDCLEEAAADAAGEPEATVFDCGTTAGNDYVECCDASSPGQPDAACSNLVTTCEPGGPDGPSFDPGSADYGESG